MPSVGHLVAQPQTQGEIRTELHFILNIIGSFRGAEAHAQWSAVDDKLARLILEHRQHRRIGDISRGRLSRSSLVLLDALHPSAHGPGVLALGDVQVIGVGEVISCAHRLVCAGCRRVGGRHDGSRSAADDNRAGITPSQKYQVRGDRYRGIVYQG